MKKYDSNDKNNNKINKIGKKFKSTKNNNLSTSRTAERHAHSQKIIFLRFSQHWCVFQDMIQKCGILAVKQGPFRGIIDVEKLEQKAKNHGHNN